jgi:hypothetical protein
MTDTEWRYLVNLIQVRACLEEVPGSMAFLVADAAARRSAKNLSHLVLVKFETIWSLVWNRGENEFC